MPVKSSTISDKMVVLDIAQKISEGWCASSLQQGKANRQWIASTSHTHTRTRTDTDTEQAQTQTHTQTHTGTHTHTHTQTHTHRPTLFGDSPTLLRTEDDMRMHW